MIVATHIAFAVLCGKIAGVSGSQLSLMGCGGVLPDIDCPESLIGRIFSPISYWLNKQYGHRREVHSLWPWTLLCVLGLLYQPLFYVGIGALSHIFIDCLTLTGVPLLLPFSHKVFVIGSRRWRIKTGSGAEFVLLAVLTLLVGGYHHIRPTQWIKALLGDYDSAYSEYLRAGENVCYLEGSIRLPSGHILKGEWLIVGTERRGMALWDGRRVLHIPPVTALKVFTKCTNRVWTARKVILHLTRTPVFFFDGHRWHYAQAGSLVWGYVKMPLRRIRMAEKGTSRLNRFSYRQKASLPSTATLGGSLQ